MPNLQLQPLLRQLTIQTKSLTTERFPIDSPFGWAQRELCTAIEERYNQSKPVRIIVLKARQLGISTATEGILFNWSFLHPGTNGLVIAHENTASAGLFEKTKFYWDTWPFRSAYTLKYATRRELSWLETRSHIKVATAKNVSSGRGSTLHAVHASECAFYPDPETLMVGLNQTIPNQHGTIVVLESTANGVGNWFHKSWLAAEEGDSEYIPLFFPWWRHYEYAIPTTLNIKSELDPEERQLLRTGASFENLSWRRWAIPNIANGDLDLFMQEYPATPSEAFITSGNPAFSHAKLKDCYTPERGHRGFLQDLQNGKVKFVKDRAGSLTLFRLPKNETRTDRYFVGGDPSFTIEGDPGCMQIINRLTYEQVAVWHGQCDPLTFADEMIRVGKYFNNAMLCPEVEGGGSACIAALIAKGYGNIFVHQRHDGVKQSFNSYGWSSSIARKLWAIGNLQRFIIDGSIKIHDMKTYDQLRNYVNREGQFQNADPDVHDDGVMALAIALTGSMLQGPFVESNVKDSIHDMFEVNGWLDELREIS